ncbi:4'-phosphopantetheinyl transferase family protein [Spirochaeta dissipatitropha]
MPTQMHIGNDIVHWNGPDAREKAVPGRSSERFIQRVLHRNEFRLLTEDKQLSPTQMLWALWAAKEAVYKAAVKAVPDLIFSPGSIQITPAEKALSHGIARIRDLDFELIWHSCEDFVHAVAAGPVRSENYTDQGIWQKISHHAACHDYLGFAGNASAAVRHLACRIAGSVSGFGSSSLRIIRNTLENGRLSPPRLYSTDNNTDVNNSISSLDISLSHDGPWSAAAVLQHE